jgi:hypothetical protein
LLATGLPDGTMLYKFTGATYQIATFFVVGDQSMWDPAGLTLEPGEGAFIRIPGTTPVTITFVGEVKQGTLTTPVPAGYSIKSSQVPQRALLSKDTSMPTDTLNLGFPAADGDMIYKWLPAQKKYEIDTFFVAGADTLWDPQAPMIEVGESFFVRKIAAVDWVRVFNVSQ